MDGSVTPLDVIIEAGQSGGDVVILERVVTRLVQQSILANGIKHGIRGVKEYSDAIGFLNAPLCREAVEISTIFDRRSTNQCQAQFSIKPTITPQPPQHPQTLH